jgi:hypothetical protein
VTLSLSFLLTSAALLTVSVLLLKQALRRSSQSGLSWISEGAAFSRERDALALEIGERIFSAEDWEIVRRETTRRFARGFRDERTALALQWLGLVRGQVSRLVHDHRRVARLDASVSVADELAMLAQFLLFELTTGILWGLILIHGPSNVAKFLVYSLDLGRKLREMAREDIPDSSSAAVAIVKTNS